MPRRKSAHCKALRDCSCSIMNFHFVDAFIVSLGCTQRSHEGSRLQPSHARRSSDCIARSDYKNADMPGRSWSCDSLSSSNLHRLAASSCVRLSQTFPLEQCSHSSVQSSAVIGAVKSLELLHGTRSREAMLNITAVFEWRTAPLGDSVTMQSGRRVQPRSEVL